MRVRHTRLTRRWDKLPADELRRLQLARLRKFLKECVAPFSPHYRALLKEEGIDPDSIRDRDDLARIPLSSKKTLLPPPGEGPRTHEFIIVPDEAVLKKQPSTIWRALTRGPARARRELAEEFRPILMTSTTGRSTEPVPFLYTRHDLDNLAISGSRMMEICRSRPEYRHFNLFPFAPHLAFWQAHYAGLGYNTFTLSTGGGKVMGTDGNVRLLGRVNPDALIGMPTFIYHVLQEAVANAVESPNLKRIVLGGEKVPDGMRRKLRALCTEIGSESVDVIATYGFTEAKMAWPECPIPEGAESSGYHLYPDLGIVEIVDPDSGAPVGKGEPGEIVFTPLDSRGSVVIRYRTGDHISGGLVHEPCPHCGRRVPRLVGRISRVSDVRRLHIDKIKGTLVNFNDLEHVLDDMDDIGTWQIEIRKRNDDPLECDELVVHVAPLKRVDRDALTTDIENRFQHATEIRPNRIEFHDAETLREKHGVGRALKEEKVVDNRPKPGTETETAEKK